MLGNYPCRPSTNCCLNVQRVYHLALGALEKPKSLEAGKTVASSMVARRRIAECSSCMPALGQIEAEYVEVALLRPNGSHHQPVNIPCWSRVGGDEATRSIGVQLGSLNKAKAKSGFPKRLVGSSSIPRHRPDGSLTRGSRWSTSDGERATGMEW